MKMSRRQFLKFAGVGAAVAGLGLVGCGGGGGDAASTGSSGTAGATVANKDKPLVWYNRQPSNSSTGELDTAALQFNKDTYYVGFDANQGGEAEGQMILDYLKKNAAKLDRNGDGVLGYVLAIGDIGHNDSIARTRGCRKVLGTGVEKDGKVDFGAVSNNLDGSATVVQDGKLTVDGKDYIIRELASKEMKNSAGATWDANTAGDTLSAWSGDFGDQIDFVVSNNDGMGMSMFSKWAKEAKVPVFGYDANNDAVAALAEGYGGTISQHPDVQAYLTLRLIRNALDGVDINTGISTADDAGNKLADDVYKYSESDRSYYAINIPVTADNYKDFLDATVTYADASKQLDESKSPKKKVWLSVYNSADNFLNATYVPLLKKYQEFLNLDVEYVSGDGQNESNITNRLGNPGEYDAFAINMVKTDNAASYTSVLSQ